MKLGLLFTITAILATAQTPEKTLQGITRIGVVVEDVGPEGLKDGLTNDQLQTDTELRLRNAGITVPDAPPFFFLHVNVSLLKDQDGLYAYNVQVAFNQVVKVLFNDEITITETWSDDCVGMVGRGRMSQAVRRAVADQVDHFLNAYLKVNPKK